MYSNKHARKLSSMQPSMYCMLTLHAGWSIFVLMCIRSVTTAASGSLERGGTNRAHYTVGSDPWGRGEGQGTEVRGSARHLYVVCIYGAICLQIQKTFPPDPAFFSSRSKTLILLYVVSKLMQKKSKFMAKQLDMMF